MTPQQQTGAQAQIRAMLDDWCAALAQRDVDRVFTHYTDDLVAFDVIGPLSFDSLADYRRHWDACMQMCPGDTIFDIRDLTLHVLDDHAWGHYLVRCGARQADGSEQTGQMRVSLVVRRTAEGWKICHEHYSMPMDPAQCGANDASPAAR